MKSGVNLWQRLIFKIKFSAKHLNPYKPSKLANRGIKKLRVKFPIEELSVLRNIFSKILDTIHSRSSKKNNGVNKLKCFTQE